MMVDFRVVDEENDWHHGMEEDAVDGLVDFVCRDVVLKALVLA